MTRKKKILGICGSMSQAQISSSQFLLEQALEAAALEGADTELIRLADLHIMECRGCGNCLSNQTCPLDEEPKDDHSWLYEKCLEADGFLFSSPVYALGLPSIWKKWIDRCDVNTKKDLHYDIYNYDTVEQVKGKAFRGKVAGQIAVAAGLGHELALAQLMPAFTAVKLTIVANVGISLMEYDSEPGIKKEFWAKDIRQADFAIDMARAAGKRVCETVGYSAFAMKPLVTFKDADAYAMLHTPLDSLEGETIMLHDLEGDYLIVIVASKETSWDAMQWKSRLKERFAGRNNVRIVYAACIGRLPHFIPQGIVLETIKKNADKDTVIDRTLDFASACSITCMNRPKIVICDKKNSQILYEEYGSLSEGMLQDIERCMEKKAGW